MCIAIKYCCRKHAALHPMAVVYCKGTIKRWKYEGDLDLFCREIPFVIMIYAIFAIVMIE